MTGHHLPLIALDSPKRFWWYHWACWILSAVGIFCILLAHDHYTIDVVVAYFITTRLFWWYHTMANQQVSLQKSSEALSCGHKLVSTLQWGNFTLYFWYLIVQKGISHKMSFKSAKLKRNC